MKNLIAVGQGFPSHLALDARHRTAELGVLPPGVFGLALLQYFFATLSLLPLEWEGFLCVIFLLEVCNFFFLLLHGLIIKKLTQVSENTERLNYANTQDSWVSKMACFKVELHASCIMQWPQTYGVRERMLQLGYETSPTSTCV